MLRSYPVRSAAGLLIGLISLIVSWVTGFIFNYINISLVTEIGNFAVGLFLMPLTMTYLFLVYSNVRALKGDFAFAPTAGKKIAFILAGLLGVLFIAFILLKGFSWLNDLSGQGNILNTEPSTSAVVAPQNSQPVSTSTLPSALQTNSDTSIYQGNGYNISYSTNWTVTEYPSDEMFTAPGGEATLDVFVTDYTGNLNDYVNNYESGTKQRLQGSNFSGDKAVDLSVPDANGKLVALPAHTMIFKTPANDEFAPAEHKILIAVYKNRVYVLDASSKAAFWDKYSLTFDSILSSFTFTK